MAKEEVKEEEKKEGDWQVGEIATQTESVIVNKKTNEQLDIPLALAKVLNSIEELKKGLL